MSLNIYSKAGADAAFATAAQGALADATEVEQVTLTAPLAYTLPVGTPANTVHSVVFTQNNVGGHTVTYGGNAVAVESAAGAETLVEIWPNGEAVVIGAPVAAGSVAWADITDKPAVIASAAHEVRVFGDKAAIFPNVDTGRRKLVFPSSPSASVGLMIDGTIYTFTTSVVVDLTSSNMASSLMNLLFKLSDKTWSLAAYNAAFDASQYVLMGVIRYDWATPRNIVSVDLRFPHLVNGNRSPALDRTDSNIRVLGHRGWLATAPENTLASFRMAKAMGLIWVEGDVRITSDGELVMIHDTSVNRTSNSTGNVADLTLAQLKALDFGAWKSAAYTGERIPTFKEWVTLCKKLNLRPFIHYSAGSAAAMVTIVRNLGMLDRVVWSSHDLTWLAAIKALLPDAELSVQLYQSGNYTTAWLDANVIPLKTAANKVEFFGQYEYMTEALSNHCVANGIGVGVWNLATPANIHQAAEWGTTTFCVSETNAGFANEMDVTAILATA